MSEETLDPIYKFKEPLEFDGEKITEIDLSEVENISKGQLRVALGRHNRNKDKIGQNYWEDPDCLLEIYCLATGKPFDFFDNLSGKDYAILPISIFGFLAS